MLPVLSVTLYFHYNICGFMSSTGPFQYSWLKGYIYSSCYYHHQIGSILLSRCYHIFRGCVSEMFVTSYMLLIAYTLRENREFVFIVFVQFMISANSRIRFGLKIVFAYSFITLSHHHHCANLSENIELIKMPIRYIWSSVWVRSDTFSQLSTIQYVGLFVFSLPISLVMIEKIYT